MNTLIWWLTSAECFALAVDDCAALAHLPQYIRNEFSCMRAAMSAASVPVPVASSDLAGLAARESGR